MSFLTRPFFCLPIKDKNSIYHTLTVFSFFIIKAICSVLPINIVIMVLCIKCVMQNNSKDAIVKILIFDFI